MLEPMNASDRKVIHDAISEIAGGALLFRRRAAGSTWVISVIARP